MGERIGKSGKRTSEASVGQSTVVVTAEQERQAAEAALVTLRAQAELDGPDAERIRFGLKVYDFAKHAKTSHDATKRLKLVFTDISYVRSYVRKRGVLDHVDVKFEDGEEKEVAKKVRRFTRRVGPFKVGIGSVDALRIYVDPLEAEKPFGAAVALDRVEGIEPVSGWGIRSIRGEISADQRAVDATARRVFKRA
jgi:hypothetical protein